MKAITLENKKLAVKEIRGSFVYYTNEKSQVKCIELSKVDVIEVEEYEIFTPKYSGSKTKKLNQANYMNDEEYSKSKYAKMSKSDFEDERKRDRINTISW